MKRFRFDEKLCSACDACAVACMDLNDIDVQAGDTPYRTVSVREDGERLRFLSEACRHCADAKCISACRLGCIERNAETGLVVLDNAGCVSCGACAVSCPFHIPSPDRSGKMSKCHGCAVRVRMGLAPACVLACPMGALSFTEEDE